MIKLEKLYYFPYCISSIVLFAFVKIIVVRDNFIKQIKNSVKVYNFYILFYILLHELDYEILVKK